MSRPSNLFRRQFPGSTLAATATGSTIGTLPSRVEQAKPATPVGKFIVLMILQLWGGCVALAAEPVTLFDLRYAATLQDNDPARIRRIWDHCHLAAALQGIVNRDAPRLYLLYVESQHGAGNLDQYWLDKLRQPGAWLAEREVVTVTGIEALVERFRDAIGGAVVYDPAVAATSNLASTIAGADNLLPIRYDTAAGSLYSQLVTGPLKLPVKVWLVHPDGSSLFTGRGTIPGSERPSSGSAKCDAYLWMKANYLERGRCTGGYGAYYLDQYWLQKPRNAVLNHHCLTNHDFFIANKAWFFDLHVWGDEAPVDDPGQAPGTDLATLKELLLSAYQHGGREKMIHIGGFVPWAWKYNNHPTAGGSHEPVASEWEYARVISAYNGFMDADAIGYGAMANASFYRHFPLRKSYPQPWTDRRQLTERGYLTPEGRVNFDGREFMIFYVGDYDCAAWVYQRMADIWDDPNRGKIPLMWCISPVLERRVPMALDAMRRSATANDYFAAADNGAGYCLPGMLQEPRGVSGLPDGLNAWATHCRPLYERWGLSLTGFVIYAHGPELNRAGLDCYQSFSPNGIVPSSGPLASMHRNMPVLRFDHDLVDSDPARAAGVVLARIGARRGEGAPPFHWFRDILKSPTWHVRVMEEIRQKNAKVELLDAPTFFELLRIHLQTP